MPKKKNSLFAFFASMLALTTGCSDQPEKKSTEMAVKIPEQKNEFLQITNLPSKNYTEVDGDIYMYEAPPSKKDAEEGKIIGSILQFKYLGQDKSGFHRLGMIVEKYGIISVKKCKDPCKVIYADDEKIPFNRNTIIGSVFEDALNSRLSIAKGSSYLNEEKYNNDVSVKRIKSLPEDIRCQYYADGFKGKPYSFSISKKGESMLVFRDSKYGTHSNISHINVKKLKNEYGMVWTNYDIVFSGNAQTIKIAYDWKNKIMFAKTQGDKWTKFAAQNCWNEKNKI